MATIKSDPEQADASYKSFPVIKTTLRYPSFEKAHESLVFFDCKFYPYDADDADAIVAVTGGQETLICRLVKDQDPELEILIWFHDDDEKVNLNSCAWSRAANGDPLLCVTGKPSPIKIFNARTEKQVKTLDGHGKEITDLVVHPLNPSILASAGADNAIRIWSLEDRHKEQPWLLSLGGDGLTESIITLAFHSSGRYILSGGMDQIYLWTLPDLSDSSSITIRSAPIVIHYPHFGTNSIHNNYVDCVSFYGPSLIFSKAAESHQITMWRIKGFPPPEPPPPGSIPPYLPEAANPSKNYSAFSSSSDADVYERLLTFDAADMTSWYIRFSIFSGVPGERSILAIANEKSKVFFWDLTAIEDWNAEITIDVLKYLGREGGASSGRGHKPRGRGRARGRGGGGGGRGAGRGGGGGGNNAFRESSTLSSSTVTAVTGSSSTEEQPASELGYGGGGDGGIEDYVSSSSTSAVQDPRAHARYSAHDPHLALAPHCIRTTPKINYAARQIAWSPRGEWCVAVGDQGVICVMGR
ncbi:hypothetical protein MMC25_001517 [Agyrium rufum]|nr:hypothetical protein [Agyrium rufum]